MQNSGRAGALSKGPLLVLYSMLRNSASGPEIGLPGRILAGLLPTQASHVTQAPPKTALGFKIEK